MRNLYLMCFGLSLAAWTFGAFAADNDTFNTNFISGKFDRSSVANALDKGINQNAIYAVQINGEFAGNIYFKHVEGGLSVNDDFIQAVTPLVKDNMLNQLKASMRLDAESKEYTFEENTSQGTLSVWFNDDVVRRDKNDDIPLTESVNASLFNYSVSNSYYKNRQTGDSRTSLPFNGHLLLGWGDFPINLDISSPDLLKDGLSTDNLSMSHLLPGIKSEASLGQTYTSSRYSEGFSFVGAQLHSVDQLLSRRERLYTPSIRGHANSNATIEVYQDKRLLYTKAVAAGDFVIDELQGLSNQTLRVVVKESNGAEHTFYYENTVVPGLLTPGTHSFELNGGRYRYGDNQLGDNFVSGEYSHGLAWLTPTLSTILSEDYRNITAGAALPLQALGAVGVSASGSSFSRDGKTEKGQSYGVNYAKYMSNGVNIQLAGYRYSTRDYYTYNDAMNVKREGDEENRGGIRNRFTATLTGREPIFDNQVSFNFLRDQYWRNQPGRTTYSVNYGGYSRYFSYNVSLSKSYTEDAKPDTAIALSVEIPLGSSTKSVYTRYNQNGGSNTTEVGMNSYDERNSYNVAASHSSDSHENNVSGSYGLNSDRYNAQVNGSAGSSSMYASGSLSGTLGLAGGHFLASNSQTSTMAVVKLDGAEDARVNGVKAQSNGYALVPLNDSYDAQDVRVDTSSLSNNVLLDQSMLKVRPKRGSVVSLDFAVKKVKYVKAVLLDDQKETAGFGALVTDSVTQEEYYVGNQGGVLLRLAVGDIAALKDIVLVNKDSDCRYTVPAKAVEKHITEDFINVGELTCLKQ
ncbi:fimbria/pilus outer membrane usher protein [Rahnella laticis]|uniref:fimbria/pilus outer membrane usher protein n=1 Tax=Rahnella laticis TaxID=2787622 RepID=UPI0018A2A206|nr:fimbria/pilus outer membrane usher protein [Rahnella laticis]MBF7993694.1 fimbrial biogenesis outer membrane usher protein [Rahnella laticis]